jgi:hypothetical protein
VRVTRHIAQVQEAAATAPPRRAERRVFHLFGHA